MTRPQRISYVLMAAMLLLVGWLYMTTLLLSTLFCFLSLQILSFGRNKLLAVVLVSLLLGAAGWGFYHFAKQAWKTFPALAESTIPKITDFAEKQQIELPFTDLASLKAEALNKVQSVSSHIGVFVRTAVFQLVYLIIGFVVATSLFFDSRFRVEGDPHTMSENLYTLTGHELSLRFKNFFHSFAIVMGAQLLISTVNTILTAIFLFSVGFQHATILVIFTFLCGLLPILGNIISNTVITAVGFTISPNMAVVALAFLILIHKLEYFLNSKIIGHRIKNPMWLTLLGLLLGEKLMGIPGMILAPVILHYIKVEASQAKMHEGDTDRSVGSDPERAAAGPGAR